jgi:hypothetical protein
LPHEFKLDMSGVTKEPECEIRRLEMNTNGDWYIQREEYTWWIWLEYECAHSILTAENEIDVSKVTKHKNVETAEYS